MTRLRRVVSVSTSLGVAAGLLTVTTPFTAHAGDDVTGTPTVQVFVTGSNTVAMRSRLRPGVKRFVLRSAKDAGLQLVKPDRGYTKREAARDVNLGLGKGRIPALKRFERNTTLVGGAYSRPGGRTVMWAELTRGRHWALDTMPTPLRAGKIRTLHVVGKRVAGGVDADATLVADGVHSWAPRPLRIPASGRLEFRNDSNANHFLSLAKLARGKTMADVRRWIRNAQQGGEAPPPIDFRQSVDTGVISGGEEMTLRFRLPPGRYVLICWWPDANMGGMPHAFMGMYRGVTLR